MGLILEAIRAFLFALVSFLTVDPQANTLMVAKPTPLPEGCHKIVTVSADGFWLDEKRDSAAGVRMRLSDLTSRCDGRLSVVVDAANVADHTAAQSLFDDLAVMQGVGSLAIAVPTNGEE